MTETPSGVWVPYTLPHYLPAIDQGPRPATRGIVIHVNAGTYDGTISWFTGGSGGTGVGAHMEIGGHGHPPVQFLPLDHKAWHAGSANADTIGIEHVGYGSSAAEWEKTNFNMIGNSAYRAAWILRHFGLGPPDISLTDGAKGNVWPHACGGTAWGGHPLCPGEFFPWQLWEQECAKAYRARWPRQ